MLIKLRFIGILLILVLNTFLFGTNHNYSSLSKMQEELNYLTKIVNDNEWWFVQNPDDDEQPFPSRSDAIKDKLVHNLLIGKADYSYSELIGMIQAFQEYSDNYKYHLKKTYIPQLEAEIKNHPNYKWVPAPAPAYNPNSPLNPFYPNVDPLTPGPEPSPATHCHSVGPPGQGFMVGTKQLGNWCSYHQNGRLSLENPYAHGKIHGISRSYHSNGYKSRETSYWNGKKNGDSLHWWNNGNIRSKHYYEDNKLNGEARTWYESGNPSTCWIYNYGKKNSNCPL